MNIDVEQVVREYIEKTIHMSLATVSGDRPWVCEVHFAHDDSLNLYFRSKSSTRHCQEIATNSNVAGNIIDKYGPGDSIVGVYFEGSAELLNAGEEQNQAAECLKSRFHIEEDLIKDAANNDGHKLYKISVTNWYVFGRFGGTSGQKYKLEWNGGNK